MRLGGQETSSGLRAADCGLRAKAHCTAGSYQQLATSYSLQATGQVAIESEERRAVAFMP